MSSKSRRFRPRLEMLDDRSLPSATYVLTGETLAITGSSGPDAIAITDTGTEAGVTVASDNVVIFQATTRITSIVVTTLEGNDTVTYDLTGPLTVTRLLNVDLGRGADTFTASLHSQPIQNVINPPNLINLGITATGDGGGDTLILNANGATVDPATARLSVDFSGQAGKDTIIFNYDPGFLDAGNVTLTKDQRR